MKRTLVISGILAMSLTSCLKSLICIDGNGLMETEVRSSQPFTTIENTTMVDVIYKHADTVGIVIAAESNLLGHIVTETSGGKLEIKTSPRNACFNYLHPPVITITTPELDNVVVTGSGDFTSDMISGTTVNFKSTGSGDIFTGVVRCNNLTVILTGSGNTDLSDAVCQNADVSITGSGDLTIEGEAGVAVFRITGSGDIRGGEFLLLSATETISGSGDIYTYVDVSLNATISGSGNIYLRGDPAITQSISGSGRIIRF